MQRSGAEGEFRSKLHRGGTAQVIKLSPQERSTAVWSAEAMGLNVCGVDMLRANHGPVVMEVNPSSGLEGLGELVDIWGDKPVMIDGEQIKIEVDGRDAAVIRLTKN